MGSERPGPSRARRALFLAAPYAAFALLLAGAELAARRTLPHLASLDLFVLAPEQQAQMVDAHRQRIFEGDPLLFWRLRPGLRDVVWDQTPVTTNAQGLRYERDVAGPAAGVFRIVCVGDSVTFGFRVPLVFLRRPQDRHPEWLPYPARMERMLRRANPGRPVEVLPLAVPGYSSHQGLAWLRRDLEEYRPDVVTLLFGWNDISLRQRPDHETMGTSWPAVAARAALARSQALAHLWRRLHAPPAARPAPGAAAGAPRVPVERFVANHLEMARLARAAGAAVAVIGPVFRDPEEHPEEARRIAAHRRALAEAARDRGIAYLEVPELTESSWPANEPLFLEHIHPNHRGHGVLARALLGFLSAQGMLEGLRPGLDGP